MKKYAKIINEQTKEVQIGVGVNEEYYQEIGMTLMDVEQAYNGNWYITGYAPKEPEPIEDELKQRVRSVRNKYLQATDFTQLPDAPFTPEQKAEYAEYRGYLRNYTKTVNWWLENPKTFDEWKKDIDNILD